MSEKFYYRKFPYRILPVLLICYLISTLTVVSARENTDSGKSSNTLTIQVTDNNQNPIEEAVLFIDDDHELERVTDANGYVTYELEDGKYILFSYATDYLDHISTLTLEGEDKTIEVMHDPAIFWSTAPADAPIGVGEANGVRLATAGGKIYLHTAYGGPPGTTEYGALHDFYVYDPETDNWSQLPDAPHAGLYGITTAYGPTETGDDAIYIMRGYWAGQRTWMARFDIGQGEWETGLNHEIPWREDLGNPYSGEGFQDYPRNGAVLVWDLDDHMYLFPGSGYSYEKYDWYRYSVSQDSWEDMGELPHKQGPGNAAVFVDAANSGKDQDYIYVQFGLSPSGSYTDAEFWRYAMNDEEWENMADHDYGADDGSMLAWDGGNYIYHTPGAYVEQPWDKGQDQKREFMRYSISEDFWTEMEKTPYNRWGGWDDAGGIVRVGDNIFGLKGGSDVAWAEDEYVSGGGDIPSNKFWKFSLVEQDNDLSMKAPQGEGIIFPEEGIYTYFPGTEVDLLAVAEQGWRFEEWLVNQSHHSDQSATTVVIEEDISIQAVFVPEDTKAGFAEEEMPEVYTHRQRIYVSTKTYAKQLEIFDMTGRKMAVYPLGDPGSYSFDLPLPKGTLIVRIEGKTAGFTQKIIIP